MNRYDWLVKAVTEHQSDACLMWPFRVDRDGYGRVSFERKARMAHRLAFKIVHGRWPEPLGLHSCDTPGCVNSCHIQEGTHAVNQADKVKRGRSIKGEQQHDAKLTQLQIQQIRSEYVPYRNGKHRLAKKFNVSPHLIRLIVARRIWRHIT